MPSQPFKIEQGRFGISLTDPNYTDACTATLADFDDFSCSITSGALNGSPNITDDTTPATWCDPEQTTPMVGQTSFEAAFTFLQDPQVMTGLSRTLFEHDTEQAWIFMGLDMDNPPKAVARVRLTAGSFGGEARVSLTSDVTFPCDGKPMICFGDTQNSESIGGNFATGATAGSPGTWTPTGSDPPLNLADLQGGVPNTITANPTTAWAVDEYVVLDDGSFATWDGAGWVLWTPPPPATGATAGTPGTWTPAGSLPPANYTDLAGGVPNVVVANPTTLWLTGEYVECANGDPAHWDDGLISGTAGWISGIAP